MDKKFAVGDILFVDFGDGVGREQKYKRTAIVLKVMRDTILVVPTSTKMKEYRADVEIKLTSCQRPSVALIDQLRSIDYSRIITKYNKVTDVELKLIKSALF